MIDGRLREVKDRVLAPLVRVVPRPVHHGVITAAALVVGVGAGVAAGFDARWVALGLWVLNRVLDGLDGAVARARGVANDLGGYLDLVCDTVVYATVPIGIATGRAERATWIACAALLASFYVNAVSWTLLAAIAEKRGAGVRTRGEHTSVHMPTGVIEGTETVILFAVMIAWPQHAAASFSLMAALVVVTIAQRVGWAVRNVR